jgi:hypothetical protein
VTYKKPFRPFIISAPFFKHFNTFNTLIECDTAIDFSTYNTIQFLSLSFIILKAAQDRNVTTLLEISSNLLIGGLGAKKQLLPRRETRQELSARKIAFVFLSATFTAKLITTQKKLVP